MNILLLCGVRLLCEHLMLFELYWYETLEPHEKMRNNYTVSNYWKRLQLKETLSGPNIISIFHALRDKEDICQRSHCLGLSLFGVFAGVDDGTVNHAITGIYLQVVLRHLEKDPGTDGLSAAYYIQNHEGYLVSQTELFL